MTKVHIGVFLYHCISLLDLFQMSSSCNKWSFLGDGFLLLFFFFPWLNAPAFCCVVLWMALGRSGVGQFALQIPKPLFSFFFAHANSMRRCLGPLHVPLKFPSIYSQLPPLGVLVTIRHGKKEQGKCDDAADKSRLPPLLTPSAVFCYLSTIDLCGASCLLFSAV